MPTTLVKLSGVIYLKGVLSSPDSAFEDARMGVAVILQQRLQASEVVVGEIYKGFLMSVDFVSNQQKIFISFMCIVQVIALRECFFFIS